MEEQKSEDPRDLFESTDGKTEADTLIENRPKMDPGLDAGQDPAPAAGGQDPAPAAGGQDPAPAAGGYQCPEKWAHLRTADGLPFNPAYCETMRNGAPVKNKNGTLRKKRGVKPDANKITGSTYGRQPGAGQDPGAGTGGPDPAPARGNLGEMAGGAYLALMSFIAGPDYGPETEAEYMKIRGTFEKYVDARGLGSAYVPPEVELCGDLFAYHLARVTKKPAIKDRIKKRMRAIAGAVVSIFRKVRRMRAAGPVGSES
jgi:hypothetical protein